MWSHLGLKVRGLPSHVVMCPGSASGSQRDAWRQGPSKNRPRWYPQPRTPKPSGNECWPKPPRLSGQRPHSFSAGEKINEANKGFCAFYVDIRRNYLQVLRVDLQNFWGDLLLAPRTLFPRNLDQTPGIPRQRRRGTPRPA